MSVSGQFKGKGFANQLLAQCEAEARAKGKHGLTVLSSAKKMPFLSDPNYLKYKGFQVADKASPYYELLYLPFEKKAPRPQFKECARGGKIADQGMVLYYAPQCPHTGKYALLIQELAARRGHTLQLKKMETGEQAQSAPSPFTTYSFFYQGEFVTNEIFGEKKFETFLQKNNL